MLSQFKFKSLIFIAEGVSFEENEYVKATEHSALGTVRWAK